MALLPDEFPIESLRFANNSSETETTSQSLIMLIRKLPSQRWDFTLSSALIKPDDADVVYGFLAARKQDLDTIEVKLPRYSFNNDVSATTTAVAGDIGDTALTVASGNGVKVGKFFTFTGHSKVYIVTGISGNSLSFAPSLRRSVSNGESVIFDEVVFTMKARGRAQEFNASADTDHVRMELNLVEAL